MFLATKPEFTVLFLSCVPFSIQNFSLSLIKEYFADQNTLVVSGIFSNSGNHQMEHAGMLFFFFKFQVSHL